MRYENYPIEKYKFFKTSDNTIIAETTFAGQRVKATAKLNPVDSFNEDYGKRLAAARCNKKVTDKRLKKAEERLDAMRELFEIIENEVAEAEKYLAISVLDVKKADKQVADILAELK